MVYRGEMDEIELWQEREILPECPRWNRLSPTPAWVPQLWRVKIPMCYERKAFKGSETRLKRVQGVDPTYVSFALGEGSD